MKLSAKPISSPGRTEKFPPPLMRFLSRTNIGSKSHRAPTRSRSSPMFLRKKANSSGTAIETAQEPSSPKVTCMGQVRVRKRSSSSSSSTTKRPAKTDPFVSCRCRWIPRALFCRQMRPKISRPVLRKWGSFFQLSFRRRETAGRDDKDKIEPKFGEQGYSEEEEDSEDDSEGADKSRAFAAESVPVPKNALILTRCRSAPYRSSSLASRFWESPLNNGSEEERDVAVRNEEREVAERNEELPNSEKGSDSRESEAPDKAGDEREEEEEEKRTEEEEVELGLGLGLAILTRCKSEPARIGEKLYPEIGYWSHNDYTKRRRRRRLGFVNYCD